MYIYLHYIYIYKYIYIYTESTTPYPLISTTHLPTSYTSSLSSSIVTSTPVIPGKRTQ